MAHEIGAVIRQKVRAAEQIPVHWDKDQVWMKIKRGPETNSRLIFYYAAASIFIAASLVVYFLNKMENEQSEQRIHALETAINSHLKSPVTPVAESMTQQQDCSVVTPPKIIARASHQIAPVQPEPTYVSETQPEIVVAEPEALEVEQQQVPEQAMDKPKVEAIIGFIPPPYEKITVAKVKRMKFRLFRENDNSYNESLNATFITARIN